MEPADLRNFKNYLHRWDYNTVYSHDGNARHPAKCYFFMHTCYGVFSNIYEYVSEQITYYIIQNIPFCT